MGWFSKSSPKRYSARIGSTQSKALSVVIDVDTKAALPEIVVVVPDEDFLRVRPKLEERGLQNKLGDRAKGIEVYPLSWMTTEDGVARFPEAVVALGGWRDKVVYRLHPKFLKYTDEPSFKPVITQEMLSDQLVLFHAAGVKSFVVDKLLFNQLQLADSVTVKLAGGTDDSDGEDEGDATKAAVPKASPVGGGLGASFAVARDHAGQRKAVTKIKATFPDPHFQPHVPDTCWYYHNKKLNSALVTMVARVVNEGPHVNEATIKFSFEDKWVDISDVHAEISEVIGVAARVESNGSNKYDSTFTVKFFDKAKFKDLPDYLDSVGKRAQSMRWSLSALANQRVAIFKDRAAVREDFYVAHLANGDEVPIDKWDTFYKDAYEDELVTEHSEEAHAKARAEAKEAHAKARAEAKEAHAKAELARVMALYAAAMEDGGYDSLHAIKALTEKKLLLMKVKEGHAAVILHGIKDLEEWPIKVRVPAAVGELAEQAEPANLVMDPDAWKAFLDVQKASQTLTIPIVLYGPGDVVKLQVLFTWDRFITKTYSRFLTEGQQWWVEGSHQGHGARETFVTDVRFDASAGATFGKDHARQLVDANKYKEFKGTNLVKLVMKTTPAAKSQVRDVDGPFPFGLLVLILEAEEVMHAYTEAGKSVNAAPTATFKAVLDPLLGPLRKLNADGKPVVGKINRYPPVCTIVAGSNKVAKDVLKDAMAWLTKQFELLYVFSMPLLTAPAVGVLSEKVWKEQAFEALDALDQVIVAISNHEFHTWHDMIKDGLKRETR
jgi:hypothetical protein